MNRRSMLSALLLLALAVGARRGESLQAATQITVTTFADELNADGDCSLREAINAANLNTAVDGCAAGSGDDVIALAAGTYVLTIAGSDDANASGDLDIAPTVSTERLTIQGAGAGLSLIDGNQLDRVFHVATLLGGLTLIDLTVQNGRLAGAAGAGVLNWGVLNLQNVVIRNNTVTGTGSGTVGGGLCNGCVTGTGEATLINTSIENNAAERGGGIFSNRPLTIGASSIISNTAQAGGGISNYGAITLTNSTVSANTAYNNSGAIAQNNVSLAISSSTISGNASPAVGGIAGSGGTVTLINTIVADNSGADCAGNLTSQGHNLSDDPSCATSFTAGGDRNNVDPRLGFLVENGGPTLTRALLIGSPAINGGTNAVCPAADQRGIARPQAAICDIGSYEREGVDTHIYLPTLLKSTP
jgi:CSLREA domain-containing protein